MTVTDKQKEVLTHLAEGLNSKAIGQKMKISPRTVEMIALVLREKFGASNAPHLIAIAFRQNIIQ